VRTKPAELTGDLEVRGDQPGISQSHDFQIVDHAKERTPFLHQSNRERTESIVLRLAAKRRVVHFA